MKTALAFFLCLSLPISILRAADAPVITELTKEEVAALRIAQPNEITKNQEAFIDTVIKVKFNHREESFTKSVKTGNYSGRACDVYENEPNRVGRLGSVGVSVPPGGVAWFSKVSTDWKSRHAYIAFARVKKVSGSLYLELIGKDLKTDLQGSKVSW